MRIATWPEAGLLLSIIVVSAGLFVRKFAPVARTILASSAEPGWRLQPVLPRLRALIWDVLLQAKVIRERPLPGLAHALVFWGFLVFGLVTLNHVATGLRLPFLSMEGPIGRFYFGFASVFSVAVILSMAGLVVRRFLVRPCWLGAVSRESAVISALILILMISYLAGIYFLEDGSVAGRANWWLHTIALFAFLPLIPHTKHLHLVLSPAAIFLARPGFSQVPALAGDEDFGIETGKQLTWVTALQVFSCVECGRCTEHCPANRTGKLLDPKQLVLGVREYLRDHGPNAEQPIVGKYVPEEALWQCTTCGACEYQCPVGIQHLPVILGMRRGLVNTGQWEDPHGAKIFGHLERSGNALGFATSERDKFIQREQLPIFDGSQQYCLWLGCMGAYETRGREIITSFAAIMQHLNVSFGVLRKEKCSGDPARRLGNDYLFSETLVPFNVEQIRNANATHIVSICPHCVRTIADDWGDVWGDHPVTVEHHSEFLARHAGSRPTKNGSSDAVAFHDPCYLSRYKGQEKESRDVLIQLTTVYEPSASGRTTFCCGAGGGRAFLGEEEGTRVNVERARQLQKTGAKTVAAACPFCQTMFRDAYTQLGATGPVPQVLDVAEIVAANLQERRETLLS